MVLPNHYPLLVFLLAFLALWAAAQIGWNFRKRRHGIDKDLQEDYSLIVAATLTLLGLLIGFSFSMATSRYDQRKNYEEAEANAIGTEFVRADLLPPANAAVVRTLLKKYLDERILFYGASEGKELEQINVRTAQLQAELWAAIVPPTTANPTPVAALVVSGMNDVLNAQGYTQAAYWNRIPAAAWALMAAIAIACNVLIGYGSRSIRLGSRLLPILPFVVSIAFMLVSDIDSPRKGIIRVTPQNLIALTDSLQAPGGNAPPSAR